MKIRSREKDVYIENWTTPVSHAEDLSLSAVLQTASRIHFLFFPVFKGERPKKKRDIYVMTTCRGWPYRVIDEEYAHSGVGRYFHPHPSEKKHLADRPLAKSRTWKIWGTSFIQELDRGKALSNYEEKRDKNIFEYFVLTDCEWIELASPSVDWEILRDTTVKAAIRRYLKEI
jgi:hypothetical protein